MPSCTKILGGWSEAIRILERGASFGHTGCTSGTCACGTCRGDRRRKERSKGRLNNKLRENVFGCPALPRFSKKSSLFLLLVLHWQGTRFFFFFFFPPNPDILVTTHLPWSGYGLAHGISRSPCPSCFLRQRQESLTKSTQWARLICLPDYSSNIPATARARTCLPGIPTRSISRR